ncbi:MAG: aldo/keto reductase [Paucimonas sp.]|nr:aldo/keto reductase [Paucimonas sp.]
MDRGTFLRLALAGMAAPGPMMALAAGAANPGGKPAAAASTTASTTTHMQQRRIPASGEMLGVIGCGTWQTFDVDESAAQRARLAGVLRILFEHGGSVIDSSPMYGRSEAVAGDLLAQGGWQQKAFVATKVWTTGREAGIRQMQESMQLLRDDRIELMQVHNLLDWRTQLKTLRAWKEQGRIRYVGVTHYTQSAYPELEAILRAEPLDFVQLNYSIAEREAEKQLLPLAADKGVGVLVNQPFGGGRLLRQLSARPLPGWAAELGSTSWAQLLLKFVVSHPAVTCAIPGTGRPEHMTDNCQAGLGPIPDASQRKRLVELWLG